MPIQTFDFLSLGAWPSDCFDQEVFIENLQTKLNELREFVDLNASYVILLSQTTEPTQGQWETAWIVQTGLPLPIPASAVLLWYDTTTSTFGGNYGTVTGFSTVYKRVPEYIKGTFTYINQINDAASHSSLRSLYDNGAALPSITFTTYVPTTVIMEFGFTCSAGATNAGSDFMLDNVKLGTQYSSVLPNGGILENFAAPRQFMSFILPAVPAGAHVARPLLGVVGAPATPSTVTWGGLGATTSFSLRAVVE